MNLNKIIETAIYGVLSVVFLAAFFFGMMYPEYGCMEPICPQESSDSTGIQSTFDRQKPTQSQKDCVENQKYPKSKSQSPDTAGWKRANRRQVAYFGNIGCANEIKKLQKMKKENNVVYTSYFYECLKRKT